MNKLMIGCLGSVAIVVITVLVAIGIVISTANKEVSLRTAIEAKQKDNKSEYDNMWKKISQVVQVSEKQMEMLKDIYVSYADARSSDSDNQIMTWVKESVPNVDVSTMNNLQNIIVSSRDSWTMRQKEIIDLSREHNKLLNLFPSNIILKFLGRKQIDITIITSSKTERVFDSGKDDDVSLFGDQIEK